MPKIGPYMNFIRLLERTQSDSDGWRKISRTLLPTARSVADKLDKVLVLEEFEDGTGRIRLTHFGADMLSYL